jgi:hypothetical protein
LSGIPIHDSGSASSSSATVKTRNRVSGYDPASC